MQHGEIGFTQDIQRNDMTDNVYLVYENCHDYPESWSSVIEIWDSAQKAEERKAFHEKEYILIKEWCEEVRRDEEKYAKLSEDDMEKWLKFEDMGTAYTYYVKEMKVNA